MMTESSPQELVAALGACHHDDPGRPALRERTITAWLPLAHHLARRYRGRGERTEDLIQVAVTGLIESVDRYRGDHGGDFAPFAFATVLGQIKHHFRDRCWFVRVPRRQQETWMVVLSSHETLVQELGRRPRVPEIASRLRVTEKEVFDAMLAAKVYHPVSLTAPVTPDVRLGDTLGACDPGYERTELRMALRAALAVLDERERLLLRLRFLDDLTQRQIGERLGVSQMHVSRLLTVTLRRLRHLILDAD